MSPRELLGEACRALVAHRCRAGLSAAGIVFGVAAVVAALAVAEGAKRRALDEAAALGVDNVFLRARAPQGRNAPPRFRPEDVARLERDLRGVSVAALRRTQARFEHAGRSSAVSIAGVTPSWMRIGGLAIAAGRWLSESDLRWQKRVVVLTPATAAALGVTGPGAEVRWEGRWFTVVGMLAPARQTDGQAGAYMPLPALDRPLGPSDDGRGAQEIAIRAPGSVDVAARRAAAILAARGHAEAAVEVTVPLVLIRAHAEAQRTFDWVLFAVGAVALVISGIGIMNIMIASVAERTSEIGVRRASGARRRDVLTQFAAEAALLCLAGGAAGVPLGAAFAALIAAGARWPVAISPSAVGLALGLAVLVGLMFGTYPAYRAAMLDPVDALRA